MKIVIAPNSFRESLSADQCCQAIRAEFSAIFPDAEYICLPIAGGGEGTVDTMMAVTGGKVISVEVCGPMGEKVMGFYGLIGDGKTAIIEMAVTGGLILVEPQARNPLLTSSYGTDELIRHALDAGIHHIILGVGGSATVDGGMRMAQALGVRFLDAQGMSSNIGDGSLSCPASIGLRQCDPRLKTCRIDVVYDMDNPLVGPRGATRVFGPQKGATPEMAEVLEGGLLNYAHVLQTLTGENVAQVTGGGTAGGMGVAAAIFLQASMKPDIGVILQAVQLEQSIKGAAPVITGEGCIDSQTVGGKTPIGVASVAIQHHVPVIGIAGVLGEGVEMVHGHGIDAVFGILPRLAPLAEVLASDEANLYHCARNVTCAMKLGRAVNQR